MVVGDENVGREAQEAGSGAPPHGAALYRIAYDESRRSLDDQVDELSSIRTRAVSFLSFIGAATAFLVGTSIKSATHDSLFYALASSATLLIAASLVLAIVILTPRFSSASWRYRLSGSRLVDDWIQDVPPPDEAQLLRALAEQSDTMRISNDGLLGKLRWMFSFFVFAGMGQLVIWITLVWIKG